MNNRIVILGGGTAGTIMANRLARLFRPAIDAGRTLITVIDQDDRHVYQPGLLFLPFGLHRPEELVKPRRRQLAEGTAYVQGVIDRVDPIRDVVVLADGRLFSYDVLIVASGARLAPEETEGMLGPDWGRTVHEFYTLEGATRLRDVLAQWPGGRLVINPVDLPIKCPVAPLEFAFLADWFFTERGIRDRVTITYVTPLDAAFTKPVAARSLGHLLEEKGIELVTEFATGRVEGEVGRLVSWDDRTVAFDLLVTVPLHAGQPFVHRTEGLGDDLGFVVTDPHTLQSACRANIFAIGDATNLPASKAGSVAHYEAEVLTENVRRYFEGEPVRPGFDGHSTCFVETGFHKALMLDFNYEVEPLPGTYPLPLLGPMALLRESRLNHRAKQLFRWVYWNLLLPGRVIPGIAPRMTLRGKRRPARAAEPAVL